MDILSAKQRYHFQDDYKFSAEQGFNIAVGLTDFDNESEPILDPSIGEIVFSRSFWTKTTWNTEMI